MSPVALLPIVLLATTPPVPELAVVSVHLPGDRETVSLDYLAADRPTGRVWIPAGDAGRVDVLEVASREVHSIAGFAVGHNRHGGPSAVSLGGGLAFIGDRATSEICTVDARQLVKLACMPLGAWPDGVQYVATTRELWITTPGDDAIRVVDASRPSQPKTVARVPLPGSPEGYAVDAIRGWFFTNLEDRDRSLAIDVRTRKVVHSWSAHCGANGPRGLAFDATRRLLFVACTDRVQVLDVAHDGRLLSSLQTGAGVDNIDYLEGQARLYVAAGRAARLTVAHVAGDGKLVVLGTARIATGSRVVVVAADGTAVIGDPLHGGVLVVAPPP